MPSCDEHNDIGWWTYSADPSTTVAQRAVMGRRFLIMIILFFCLFCFVVLWLMFSIFSFWLFMRQANSWNLYLHLAFDSVQQDAYLPHHRHAWCVECYITILHSLPRSSWAFLLRELCKDTSRGVKTSREACQMESKRTRWRTGVAVTKHSKRLWQFYVSFTVLLDKFRKLHSNFFSRHQLTRSVCCLMLS